MRDPPNTRVFARYYAKAIKTAKAARAGGREDIELLKQMTRLRWLVAGNGAAAAEDASISPVDPLQLMCFAEYNRVQGSELMVQAAGFRAPKSWSNVSRRSLGNGKEEITTTTFTRPPTAEEMAAADRLDAVAKGKEAPRVARLQDLALKLQVPDPRLYFLWSRVEAAFYDRQLAERIVQRGLMIDPGSAELHAVRVVAWLKTPKVNKAEVYCVDKFSKPYTANDLQAGGQLARLDPAAGYYMTLQRLRTAPDEVGSHAVLCDVLDQYAGQIINDQEAMPDAQEQRQRELGVAVAMEEWILERPEQWSKGVPGRMPATRNNIVNILINLLTLRAADLVFLKHPEQARVCRQKILVLDPTNKAARQGLE